MPPVLSIRGLNKSYKGGLVALKDVNLDIEKGEILALLGPNGAGKTTLINAVCGIVTPTSGEIIAAGFNTATHFREARSRIGLVPQEMHIDIFETVWAVTTYSRGLFGLPPNDAYVEKVLKDLSLWDKRKSKLMELSGGMKRRVLIAKALVHEPEILFLDEPTAGVDVELRRDMWGLVRKLRENGCTIILTTHYIEEAEEMADRVGVISKGELVVVEEKKALMKKLGKKSVSFHLLEPLPAIPDGLKDWQLSLKDSGHVLEFTFDTQAERTGVTSLIKRMSELGVQFRDLDTKSSSLEDIFVSLVHAPKAEAKAEKV
jgi:ABC-2 type transport system ATP-binding protein